MAVDVSRVDVWTGEIEDRSGGLSEKIEAVSDVVSAGTQNRPAMGGFGAATLMQLAGTVFRRQHPQSKDAGHWRRKTVRALLAGSNLPDSGRFEPAR